MERWLNILSQEIVQRIGWALIHFIWQGILVTFLLAIVLRLMRKSSASLRYIISLSALMIMIAMPVITFELIGKEKILSEIKIGRTHRFAPTTTETVQVEMPMIKTVPSARVEISFKDKFVKIIEAILAQIVCLWLVGVILLSVWNLGGWRQLQRLRRRMVTQVSDEIKQKLEQLSQVLGIKRAVDIFQSALVNVPTVIGHFKPVILLPVSALTGLTAEQIEAILAHELAHIKRCDYLVNILQTVVEILGFYHPAVWWVSNKIRYERENCCDDIAVNISGNKICYAEALATMEEIRFGQGRLAIAAAGGNLFERIKRLLGEKNTSNEKAGWLPSVIVISILALIPAIMLLSSCDKEKNEPTEMNAKINQIDIDTATRADVIKVFGEPEKYMWREQQVIDKDNLPEQYIMVYPNNFYVWMVKDQIIEFRFEGPSDYVYSNELVVGSSIEKTFSVLGQPSEIVEGRPNEFKDHVFYKDINGRKGHCYYARPEKNIRIWFAYDKVHSIYLTRSNFSASGSKKLKENELPEGSIIDANGYIVDKLDYPFVNDPQVLGIWQSVDYVREIEKFQPGKQQSALGLFLKELIFKNDGRLIHKNDNEPNGFPEKWTKGLVLYDNDQKTASKYIIKEIGDSQYMFFEWKSGDYTFRHQKPSYYVLKKIEENQANTDYSSVTVKEGIGFDDVIVGDPKCTKELLISKFGQPEDAGKYKEQWLNYRNKYGFDFWLNQDGLLTEIRFNPGFKGRLQSGISMQSKMEDVFRVYGKPVAEENIEKSQMRADNQTLFLISSEKPQNSYIWYKQNWVRFWFVGEKINQIITFPKPQTMTTSEPNEQYKTFIKGSSSKVEPEIDITAIILFADLDFFEKHPEFNIDKDKTKIIDERQHIKILKSNVKTLSTPKVKVIDGEDAHISLLKARQYISGYKEPNGTSEKPVPVIQEVVDGIKLEVKPEFVNDKKNIKLTADFKYSKTDFQNKLYKEKYEFQIPEPKVISLASTVTINLQQTVLLGGEEIETENGKKILLVLLNATRPDSSVIPAEPTVMQVYEVNNSVADFLNNPGAEAGKDDLPSSWFKACIPAEGLKMYRDTENVHSGKYSFAIANTHKYDQTVSNNWAQNIQNVPVGNLIKVSAYTKTENADSVNVCIQCWGLGDSEKMLAFTSTNILRGNNNWVLLESPPVLVPVGTVKITVRAVLTGTGNVWFDDINVNTINTSDENKKSASFGSNAANFSQQLEEPVTVHVDKSPDGDRLTIQYAVIAICNAAKVPYNWDKSAELAEPQRTNYINPVNIENKVASQAIADLIGPVGLLYGVDANGIYLYNREIQTKKRKSDYEN